MIKKFYYLNNCFHLNKMGIKNLHMFLRKKCSSIYNTIPISTYSGKKIAIDTSIYMCRYKSSLGNKWLSGFWNLIMEFSLQNIEMIFIFDAKAPPEKDEERQHRAENREKNKKRVDLILDEFANYKIKYPSFSKETFLQNMTEFSNLYNFFEKQTDIETFTDVMNHVRKLQNSIMMIRIEDFDLLREMLDVMGIVYMNAFSEAEGTCAFLNRNQVVDAVLTEDTDVLAYLSPVMLHNYNIRDNTFVELKLDDILEKLSFTAPQFVDFCIMCGTDYNTNIPGIGPQKAYQILLKKDNLEHVETEKRYNTSVLNFVRVRELFKTSHYKINDNNSQREKIVKINDVQNFCFHNNIDYNIRDVNTLFSSEKKNFHIINE